MLASFINTVNAILLFAKQIIRKEILIIHDGGRESALATIVYVFYVISFAIRTMACGQLRDPLHNETTHARRQRTTYLIVRYNVIL